jgi:hypothetical protein
MKLLKTSNGYSRTEHPTFLIVISPAILAIWNMQLVIQSSI